MVHIETVATWGRWRAHWALATAFLLCSSVTMVSAQPIGSHVCSLVEGSSIVLTTTLGPITLDTVGNGNVRFSCGEIGPQPRVCPGDCDGDGEVHINESILGVQVGLQQADVADCSNADLDDSGTVEINEMVSSVSSTVNGCPVGMGAECTCDIIDFAPLNLSGIGFVCNYPATGCEPGIISCSGGERIGVDLYSERVIGDCTSNEQCEQQCTDFCAERGTVPTVTGFGCEGFCKGGERDGLACDCDGFNPTSCTPGPVIGGCPGGECPGQNRAPGGICECQCLDTGVGRLTQPGGTACNLGSTLIVEQTIGVPCDGEDLLVEVGTVCIPMTTETATSTLNNVNDQPVCQASGGLCTTNDDCDPGDTCGTNKFEKSLTGAPLTCDQLRESVTGLHVEGVVNFFGSDLGDILTQVSTVCEEGAPPACPLAEGSYTMRQTTGGTLQVDGLLPFPFPAGGRIVADIAPGVEPDCLHDVVVPDSPVECVGGTNDRGSCTDDDDCPTENGTCDLTQEPARCDGGRNDNRTCTSDENCPPETGSCKGGFSAPVFCIPGLNFSVMVEQTACGVGRIDSDGGSDFTVTETGDTSAPSPAPGSCGLPASSCEPPPGDSNVRVDVTVGDGTPDICTSGTANAIVSVPVFTTTWTHAPGGPGQCPDPDGMPGGMGDNTVVAFPQILDFTTDANSTDWSDLDPDGCCLAGTGPASEQACAFAGGGPAGLSGTGVCMDLDAMTVTTAASGTIGSNGGPLYDLTFTTRLPNGLEGPRPALNATCDPAPQINFDGTTMRCIP